MFAKFNMTALAAVAVLGFSVAAHAAPVQDTVSVKVSVAGVDLSSEAGAKVALQRIHVAATTICGDQPEARQFADAARYKSCMKAATDSGVASLGSSMVTALYKGDTSTEVASSGR
jgi:UrcA family protein